MSTYVGQHTTAIVIQVSTSLSLSLFSLNRRHTVQPDDGRVRGQLCEGERSQSRASNLDCIWGRGGGATQRTEVFEARHFDVFARGTSCERWLRRVCRVVWSRGSSNWLVKERRGWVEVVRDDRCLDLVRALDRV